MKVYDYNNNFTKTDDITSNLSYGYINKNLEFTISIPMYGLNPYFEKLLAQLKKFSNKFDFQIILSDGKVYDNNNNEVINLLDKYSIKNLAYFISDKRLTQYNNFNRCIYLAESEFVSMIHDDDLFVEDYIEIVKKTISYLKKHPKIGMVQSNFKYFHNDDEIQSKSNGILEIYKIKPYIISLTGKSQTAIPSCGVLFRKKAFIESGGYNDAYFASGDSFLSVTMMNKGYDIFKYHNLTGNYRVAVNSSLKVDTCIEFSKQEYQFVQDWKKGKFIANIWLSFMNNYIYSKNIDFHCSAFSSLNKDITINNLDYRKKYKKYKKWGIHEVMFKVAYKVLYNFKYINI